MKNKKYETPTINAVSSKDVLKLVVPAVASVYDQGNGTDLI